MGSPGLAAGGYEVLRVVHLVTSRAKHPTDSPVSGAGSAGRDIINDAICILMNLILTLAS